MKKNKEISENQSSQKVVKGRKFKYGVLSTSITLVFLAIVIIVNAVATLLLERFPVSIDLTPEQVYKMDDKTIKYIQNINTDINITFLMTNSEFESAISNMGGTDYINHSAEMLKKFHQYNSKIKVKFLDLDKEPDFVSKFKDESLSKGNILIDSKLRYKVLSIYECFNIEVDQYASQAQGSEVYAIKSSKLEDTLLSGIMYVVDENPVRVAVVKGHNEEDTPALSSLLQTNNYELKDLRLVSEDLSDYYDAVVISAPKTDLTEAETKKLDNFLYNNGKFGKNLIYFASAAQAKLPKIESYLKSEWGVEVGDGTIYETDTNRTLGSPEMLFFSYGDETYSDVISDKNNMLLLGLNVRPLKATFTEDGNRKTSVLYKTQKSAVVKPLNASDKWKAKDGTKGEYVGGILATRSSVYNSANVQSNVSVMGFVQTMDVIDAQYSVVNRLYTLNMFDKMTQRDSGIKILPKTIGYNAMGLTTQTRTLYAVLFIGIIPLACLCAGFVIWLRRRHK